MPSTTEKRELVLNLAKEFATAAERYQLPVEIPIAMALLETGWGKHVIGEFNWFGMKKRDRHTRSVSVVVTHEYFTAKEIAGWARKDRAILQDGEINPKTNKARCKITDQFADWDTLADAAQDFCWLISSNGGVNSNIYRSSWDNYQTSKPSAQAVEFYLHGIAGNYSTSPVYAQTVLNILHDVRALLA
jgi:flagellum-specific peptidoglycan hydrolase FlgJ